MALWKDGSAPSVSDLVRYENGIGDLASTESINLAEKILLARQEVGSSLFRFLLDQGALAETASDLPDVAVTEPLQRWVTLKALALTYREAHFSNLSERYKGKWTEYSQQAFLTGREYFETGVGRVTGPVGKPGAPTIAQAAGALPANTYYVAITWVTAQGVESEGSEVAVRVTSEPATIIASHSAAPLAASGWNVFAGIADNDLGKQNVGPISIGSSWTLPAGGLIAGVAPGQGQLAEYYIRARRSLQRG
ncbi:MAG TPA: hypothetical protein VM120_28470 [Bryobacteraceae bacterium]|nr:hypothetical protein [Bryobacteraceae bacterium]